MPGRQLQRLAVSDGFRSYVLDQLEGLGDVAARPMFGGVGLYCRGMFFGIVAGDCLYLKVDAGNRPAYEQAGEQPFQPYANRPATMQYYRVPLEVLESAPDLVAWALDAVKAAERQSSSRG
jgi:DNA transformation protein and related proteins